jgi:radical SAM superfamily enzyme YgiQ (UPF0313 family)
VKKKGLKFQFHCNARSDLIDKDIIQIYKELHITRLAIGIESGDQRIINEVLHKYIDLEKAREIFYIARSLGVRTHAHFMIGIPGETWEDMQRTLDYALSIPVDSVEFNILTPWPGTRFYELCKERGWLVELEFEEYNEKRRCVVSTEYLSHLDVIRFYEHIRRTFIQKGWINSEDGSVYFANEKILKLSQSDTINFSV